MELVKDLGKEVKELGKEVKLSQEDTNRTTLLVFQELSMHSRKMHNPWKSDFLTTASENLRHPEWRNTCLNHYGIVIIRSVKSLSNMRYFVQCMFTGIEGDGEQIPCCHLAPLKTKSNTLKLMGLDKKNLENPRNSLLLCKGIETAFDELKLSLVEIDIYVWLFHYR